MALVKKVRKEEMVFIYDTVSDEVIGSLWIGNNNLIYFDFDKRYKLISEREMSDD